jgi:hypothetical protein
MAAKSSGVGMADLPPRNLLPGSGVVEGYDAASE